MASLSDRTERFYDAELLVHHGEPWCYTGIADADAAAAAARHHPVWSGAAWQDTVTVTRGRSTRYGALAYYHRGKITVSVDWFGPGLLAHELAHLAAGGGAHDATFAAWFRDLLAVTVTAPHASGAGDPYWAGRAQLLLDVGCALAGVPIGDTIPTLPGPLAHLERGPIRGREAELLHAVDLYALTRRRRHAA